MPPCPLDEIETWVFDLDNTLYAPSASIYRQVEERMNEFIMSELKLEREAAQALRRRFFEAHGTTLRGLMNEYGMPPGPFLDYCHDLDLSPLARDERLAAAIAALPGRKLIFTNATVSYAGRVLAQLGLEAQFSAIHDIEACNFVPKPDPSGYHVLLERYGVRPARSAMIEDVAKNLVPAAALGMTTIWLKSGPLAKAADGDSAHIHHAIDDLHAFLADAVRTAAG